MNVADSANSVHQIKIMMNMNIKANTSFKKKRLKKIK